MEEGNEEIKKQKPRLMLLDSWNVMISQNSVANILDQNTMQVGMYLTTMNMLRTFVEKFKPHKVVFAMDGPQAGERRRKLYSGYKAGRRVKAKTSSVSIQEDDDDYTKYASQGSFTFQLERIYNFIKLLPVSIAVVPYCEGDDIIAYLALKNQEEFEVIIVSGDKDYCQLINENISVYSWRKKTMFDEAKFLEDFKIQPYNYIYMKILLGDSSDEIKNANGIGKKTFEKIAPFLADPENRFDNVGEFAEFLKGMDLTGFTTREKNIMPAIFTDESMDKMNMLYRVMKLDENCLQLHHIDILRAQIDEQEAKTFSRLMANVTMLKHQFNKLYFGFNNERWLQPFVFIKPNTKIKV